ncbi:TIGR02450 family Trp-rich protein [Corallincola luteus]|uniref:TIGR02450 family Trp-rich protein n=3 Tax=Psychromonadaceae TaxID=267894 RepID=A0ABY1WQQ6_9GAMM|nr:TIGR02450 family Trp-rich protein [Corallincola spongiicola]TCI04706.1 TIGR02450 family Trp-rich protein [Corallincola luteus]
MTAIELCQLELIYVGEDLLMNSFDPEKLRMTKWTAVGSGRRRNHYVVTDVVMDEAGAIEFCTMEEVGSHHEVSVDWQELYDNRRWQNGWK